MLIDLSQLCSMHPRLPVDQAVLLVGRAALGLERNGHVPGVELAVEVERLRLQAQLAWPDARLDEAALHDYHHVTEEGAEAVMLGLVHQARGWQIVRRMQRKEHGDWLLEQKGETGRSRIALEISGVDKGSLTDRLREKLVQVAKSEEVDQRWAGVVGFERPTAALRSSKAGKHGR